MLDLGEQMNKEAKHLTNDLFALADPDGTGKLWWSVIPVMFDSVSDDNLRRAVDIWEKLVDRMLESNQEMDGFYYTYD